MEARNLGFHNPISASQWLTTFPDGSRRGKFPGRSCSLRVQAKQFCQFKKRFPKRVAGVVHQKKKHTEPGRSKRNTVFPFRTIFPLKSYHIIALPSSRHLSISGIIPCVQLSICACITASSSIFILIPISISICVYFTIYFALAFSSKRADTLFCSPSLM